MKTNRRDFFKLAAASLAGAGAAGVVYSDAKASSEEVTYGPNVVAKLYDSTKCVGCQSCVVACYRVNFQDRAVHVAKYLPEEEQNFIQKEDMLPKVAPEDEFDPEKPWLNVVTNDYRYRTVIQKFTDDDGKVHFIKRNCMHCRRPGCASACPVSALQKDPDSGVVTYDPDRCIGCRYCQMACPFNVPKFEWTRAVPKISKCDMCWSTKGKNKVIEPARAAENPNFRPESNYPACTRVCPAGAVLYGYRSELLEEAKKRITENPGKYYKDMVLGEKIYGGTDELYLAAADFKDLGFPTDKIPDYSAADKSEGLQHTLYKGFIAPIALYTALAIVGYRNNKKHHSEEGEDK